MSGESGASFDPRIDPHRLWSYHQARLAGLNPDPKTAEEWDELVKTFPHPTRPV
jgi:hypothetical protein